MRMRYLLFVLTTVLWLQHLFAAEYTGLSQTIPENTLQIIQINSGSTVADIYLIRLPDGRIIGVDTGESHTAEAVLIPAMDRHGVKEIDVMILTHFHLDHVGGLLTLINDPAIRIRKILYTSMPYDEIPGEFTKRLYSRLLHLSDVYGIPAEELKVGDRLDFGSGVTAVVSGAAEYKSKQKNLNSHSLVFQLNYQDFTALFTGDCSMQEEPRVLASGLPLKSDLLKVGHHAGANSTSARFLDTVSPKVAIACMPQWLSDDARGLRVENMLKERKIPFFRSWEYPDAVIFSNGKEFGVFPGEVR